MVYVQLHGRVGESKVLFGCLQYTQKLPFRILTAISKSIPEKVLIEENIFPNSTNNIASVTCRIIAATKLNLSLNYVAMIHGVSVY